MIRLSGIAGAPGVARGTTAVLQDVTAPAESTADGDPAQRFAEAQAETSAQLQGLATELHAEGKHDEAAIFEAQAMLALDPALSDLVKGRLAQPDTPLSEAVQQAAETMATMLGGLDDPYLRERAADVRAVGVQISAQLHGARTPQVAPGSIVIAADLTPAQTAALRKSGIAGFATASGTATGHVAILARGLGIPAIVGMGDGLLAVIDGAPAILDADSGVLIIAPDADVVTAYDARIAQQQAEQQRLDTLRDLPAITADGQAISLWANIGHPDDVHSALAFGAEGIGLFRTEFLFLDRDTPPDENEQYQAYATVLRAMAGKPVVIRTIDIGGDKPIPYLPPLHEPNPFLGWRGVRFAMRFPDLFQVQLRALLRAATEGDLRVMLPMIATPDDVAWARAAIDQAAHDLAAAGRPHRADPALGIMIETPAAVVALGRIAPGISFGSIGSNDLAQYTLAADRGDGQLITRYQHDDPAVWRMIRLATETAQRLGLELSLCGELGSHPQAAVALVGLGLSKLSMTPTALPRVKEALRATTSDAARALAKQMCADLRG